MRRATTRRHIAHLIVSLLATLAPGAAAQDIEDVVERYPGGAVRCRYGVDPQGRKQGTLTEYAEAGHVVRVANYKDDVLHGKYVERNAANVALVATEYRQGRRHGSLTARHPNGKLRRRARFREGRLHGKERTYDAVGELAKELGWFDGLPHGKSRVYEAKAVVWEVLWEKGRLRSINGEPAYPRPPADVRARLATFGLESRRAPTFTDAEQDRQAAFERLRGYRYLCGVPYDDLILDAELCKLCDAAADVCHRLGRTTHEPPNPGLPLARYLAAKRGAINSNLSGSRNMAASVDSYMDDSDRSNIDDIGHRQWCLNPAMLRTGFGRSASTSAMWATDASRRRIPNLDFVAFPPPGFTPAALLADHIAWSIVPHPHRFARTDALRVTVQRLDEGFLPVGAPLPLGFFNVSERLGNYCIIFRPDGLDTQGDNARYWVTVDGFKRKRRKAVVIRYLVDLVGPTSN